MQSFIDYVSEDYKTMRFQAVGKWEADKGKEKGGLMTNYTKFGI